MHRSITKPVWPLLAAVLLLASACETTPATPSYPEITFGHMPKIPLNVARIEVVDAYKPPLRAPNVEHWFPRRPAAVARRWVKDRLQAVGRAGSARVTIQDASAIEEKLATTKGLKGAVTRDQAFRYVVRLAVRVDVETAGGLGKGFAEAQAKRTRSAPEDITLNDRDKLFFEMTEALARDIDRELEANIRLHLRDYLK